MAEAFKEYWDTPKKKPMETLLRLKGKRGQDPSYIVAARRARDFEIAFDMWLLQHKFRLTVDEAAEVVHAKIGTSRKVRARWGEKLSQIFSHESLTKLYSSKWKPAFGLTKAYFNTIEPYYSSKFWPEFLKGFPTSTLSASLKAKLLVK